MIGVALISSSVLNLGPFMEASRSVTGENHVQVADRNPGLSRLADDMNVLRNFAGKDVDLTPAVMNVGFLVAGMPHAVSEAIEYARGMAHLYTSKSLRIEIDCVMISGSLDQWQSAVIKSSQDKRQHSEARNCYNQIYTILCQEGLSQLFVGYRTKDNGDGTFLLLESK